MKLSSLPGRPGRKPLLYAAAVLLLVALMVDFGVQRQSDARSEILAAATIHPADFHNSGIFTLEGVELLSTEYIQKHLVFQPEAEFSVRREAPGDSTATIQVIKRERSAYTITLLDPFGGKTLRWEIPPPVVEVKLLTSVVYPEGPIRLYVSDPVGQEELMEHLSISPEVEFRAMMYGETVNVLPMVPLEPDREYILTVKKGLASENGAVSDQEYRFRIRAREAPSTARREASVRLEGHASVMAAPGEDIPLSFVSESLTEPLPVTVTAYRFPNADEYAKQVQLFLNYGFDPEESLEEAGGITGLLSEDKESLTFPAPEPGAYLLEAVIQDTDIRLRKAVYVTDLSVYMQSLNGQTLVWANSASDGRPLAGYTVEFLPESGEEPFASARTGSDGVALVDRRQKDDGEYHDDYYGYVDYEQRFALRLRDDSGATVYVDTSSIIAPASEDSGQYDKYYSTFYTDRAIYKPTDEINFWGTVKPHAGNRKSMPSTVDVRLGELDISASVRVDEHGSFHGKLRYDAIKSSQYDLTAALVFPASGGEDPVRRQFEYQWLDVKEYEKPLFTIQTEIDKEYYLPGETVKVRVVPQFYDGTPLPFYTLEFSSFSSYYGEEGPVSILTTDETGVAVMEFPASYDWPDNISWTPLRNRYRVRIASDGQNISHYGEYVLFPSEIMVTGGIEKQDNGNLTIRAGANRITIPADFRAAEYENGIVYSPSYHRYSYERFDYAALKGAPADIEITAKLEYEYRDLRGYRLSDSKTVTLTAANGIASLQNALPGDFDPRKPYYLSVVLSVPGPGGSAASFSDSYSWYPRGWREPGEGSGIAPGYSFTVADRDGGDRTGEYYEYMTYQESSFGDREEMNFSLVRDGEPARNTGRILYTLIQNGVIERGVTTDNTITLTQNANWAQTVTLCAAYFDGRSVHPIRDTRIEFEMNSLAVNIDVEADQAAYRPGDTVRLNVTATETVSGAPVEGSAVISVVDEAVFALREQHVDLLDSLFGDMYFYNYFIPKYTTTGGDLPYPGGGDGGKGDGGMADFYNILRKNFKDTAAFLPVRTGVDGKASVSFTLPDNLTSWRITTLTVGDNLYAGNTKYNIISTLPFFMQPILSSKYVYGDEVAMLVQGHGDILNETSDIRYAVTLRGDNFEKTFSESGKAYESRPLNFGKLETGEYTLSATAEHAGYSDTVELPVYVIPSSLELVVNREIDLTKPIDIEAVRYPVTISFYDQEHEAYFKSVSSLLTHYCMIANQRMSRFVAKRALTRYMEPEEIPQHIRQGNESCSDMQNEDGGIGWYPGDPSQPVLTAKVLLVADDQFNRAAMTRYFNEVLTSSGPMDHAAAHLGLAALGSPQVLRIEQLLQGGLTGTQRAYLVAALAYGGETELAERYYNQFFAPLRMETANGVYFRESAVTDKNRIPKNGGYIETYKRASAELTAAVWIAASKLGLEDADGISLYFAQDPWRINTLFEGMIYVTNYNKEVTPASVTYQAGGLEHTVSLGLGGQKSISLNRSETAGFQVIDPPENVLATAYYIGEPGEVDIEPSELIQIDKQISSLPDDRYRFDITVRLLAGSPSGDYDITEWIPSNMRLYRVMIDDQPVEDWWWNFSQEGQKLRFRIWRGSRRVREQTIRISYIAQRTFDSVAVVDSTYIIHGNSGANNYTERYILDESGVPAGSADPDSPPETDPDEDPDSLESA